MRIDSIMSSPAVTCLDGDRLNHAAKLMWEHDVGSIPVVDDNGSLVGIITDRDICMAAYTQGKALNSIPVHSAMAREVTSATSRQTVEKAQKIMRENRIRRLPIVDDANHPVGVLSLNDVARKTDASKKKGECVSFVKTMAEICEPRRSQLRAAE